LFARYLKVTAACAACGAPLGLARADDLPPYLTILVAGHVIVPLMLLVELQAPQSTAVMAAIFLPLAFAITLGLLQPIKGAVVGLMLRLDLLRSTPDA
jgi:uncharacterized protein (DUF983 family)